MPRGDPNRVLVTLLSLTSQLTKDVVLEESLQAVTDATIALLPGDHASIRLLDHHRTSLLTGARSGSGSLEHPMEFQRGQGIVGWVVDRGEPLQIGEIEEDERFLPRSSEQRFPMRSIMAEPLWANGDVIGVLATTAGSKDAFNDADQLLLRLLANCSSPPIERARLRRLAMFDDLTMAYNQRYLYPRLIEEIARAGRTGGEVSVLLLDLDHFKHVNDEHGHRAGDITLRAFADRVRVNVRRIDVFLRRGGEEFVLIMPETGITQAHATANRIRESVEKEPLTVRSGLSLAKTVSIGVATWSSGETPEQLEHRADQAMYEAKRLGRNRVVVAT